MTVERQGDAVNMLWRDLLNKLQQFGTVLSTNDCRLIMYEYSSQTKVALEFGPQQWFEFVNEGADESGAGGLTKNPQHALDELYETLGSDGSPVRIEKGRLVGGS